MYTTLFVSSILLQFLNVVLTDPVVTVEQGEVLGKIGTDYNGNSFYSFLGIPFAKPPLGELRFKTPQPPDNWNGTFNATVDGNSCFQRGFPSLEVTGSEDCLFISVYTPELPTDNANTSLKAVMVYIFGGGFVRGSCTASSCGPEFLLTEDVVLVTFNYRLGLLGFVNFEDPSLGVPGNTGLKDAVFALQWIQKNIAKFSGDPNSVTIFGQSAGARAVNALILSPRGKGLFHKAISESGSILSAYDRQLIPSEKLATALGVIYTNDSQLLDELKVANLTQLLEAQEELFGVFAFNDDPKKRIFPVVETYSPDAIITEAPIEILNNGTFNKIPILIGHNSREGMVLEVNDVVHNRSFTINTDYENYVPPDLNLQHGSAASEEVARKAKQFFLGDWESGDPVDDKIIEAYYLLLTDSFFVIDIYGTAKRLNRKNTDDVYFYRFTIDTPLNYYKQLGNITLPGTCHTDELNYIFNKTTTPVIEPGSIEDISIRRMVKLWTNFAKYGNPNSPQQVDNLISVQWKPMGEQFHYLDIGKVLKPGVIPDEDTAYFWNEIYRNYSVNPNRREL